MGIEKHPVFDDINTLLKSLGYFLLNPVFKNDTERARYMMNAPYDAQMIDDVHKVRNLDKAMQKVGLYGIGNEYVWQKAVYSTSPQEQLLQKLADKKPEYYIRIISGINRENGDWLPLLGPNMADGQNNHRRIVMYQLSENRYLGIQRPIKHLLFPEVLKEIEYKLYELEIHAKHPECYCEICGNMMNEINAKPERESSKKRAELMKTGKIFDMTLPMPPPTKLLVCSNMPHCNNMQNMPNSLFDLPLHYKKLEKASK